MAKVLVFPAQYASISVGEVDYHPDADGMIHVEDESHIPDLVRFGAHDPASVIVFADQPVEDTPETVEEPAAVLVAEEPVDAPETPSEATVEGADAPTEESTKNDLVEWLVQQGVDVPSKMSKSEAWEMVQGMIQKMASGGE